MFCDACGSAMSAEQRFCASCGKQTGVAPSHRAAASLSAGTIASDGRVAKHLGVVAALWIVIGALTLLLACVLLAIGIFPFDRFIPRDAMPEGLLGVTTLIHVIFLVVGAIVFLIACAHFLAAWGLMHHAPWARILTIAFAFLRILEVPYGTALAIYTIWVLMGPASEQEYRALGAA